MGMVDGAVAVVTGGSSGIGRAVCRRLAEEGAAAVVVVDVAVDVDDIVGMLGRMGVEAAFVQSDVREPLSLERAVAEADRWGGVTVLVTCAGVLRVGDVLDTTEEDFDLVLDVNLKGTFFACQAAARSMIGRGAAGSIVTLSSVAGFRGDAASAAYVASKGGVTTLTYALAAALGPRGVRVNAVHPGLIPTAMTAGSSNDALGWNVPSSHRGTAEDVADAVVYFASPRASFVNGASLAVDGGQANSL